MSVIDKASCRVYIKSVQGGVIRTVFEVLKDVIFDSNLICTPQGCRLATMDVAKASLVYLKLRAESFEEFICKEETRIGLNMASIYKLVKTCTAQDTIILYVQYNAPNELGIRIQKADKNSRTDFKLKLLDVDGTDINLPDIEFENIYTLPSGMFQRLCRDMQHLSPNMTISSQGTSLTLSCIGEFASQTTVLGEADEGLAVTSTGGDDDAVISQTYSLKYLTLFSRASNLCNTMSLYIKKNHPLVIQYHVASLGEIKFLLTPQLDDDDDEYSDDDDSTM